MNLANEGLEARKKDEEVAQKKRKVEDDKLWEGGPLSFTSIYLYLTVALSQKLVNSGLVAGVPSHIPTRRRKKPSLTSLDEGRHTRNRIFLLLLYATANPDL